MQQIGREREREVEIEIDRQTNRHKQRWGLRSLADVAVDVCKASE